MDVIINTQLNAAGDFSPFGGIIRGKYLAGVAGPVRRHRREEIEPMKKFALTLLAVALLVTLVCGTAMAATGDLTMKAVKAYSDPNMTKYIGTIPAYTSVMVRAYGSYADVYVNGVECYISPSALTKGEYDYNYVGAAVLKKGATVYQRPTHFSKFVTAPKARAVLVYAVNDGFALIRSDSGVFGFVGADDLTNLKAR